MLVFLDVAPTSHSPGSPRGNLPFEKETRNQSNNNPNNNIPNFHNKEVFVFTQQHAPLSCPSISFSTQTHSFHLMILHPFFHNSSVHRHHHHRHFPTIIGLFFSFRYLHNTTTFFFPQGLSLFSLCYKLNVHALVGCEFYSLIYLPFFVCWDFLLWVLFFKTSFEVGQV